MADDGGVIGNLPRSRPGQRSEKRTGGTAAKARTRKGPASVGTTAPKERASAKATARKEPAAVPAGDPARDAVRIVTGVAATGARVAGGVAREVLRRLPRP
jgi:hypothetical protein